MSNEEYDELIKEYLPKDNIVKNVIISFVSGGLIGVIAQIITNIIYYYFNTNINDAYLYTTVIFIIIGSLLTGLGFFDKILSICKCGLIVPTTGFANTMTSSAMDARSEGFVKGIAANIYKLTGSIILYGIVFGVIFGFIRSVL